MIDSGAAVILQRRDVFLSASLVDITDEAIAAIDTELGEGTEPQAAPDSDDAPSGGEGTTTDPAAGAD
jgi:hypothetical protein